MRLEWRISRVIIMGELKYRVLDEFRTIAQDCHAEWTETEDYCEFSKNGIIVRIRWSIERISGVFVTLMNGKNAEACEYGLPYLVEFLHGKPQDLANASSDDPKLTAEVVRQYASSLIHDTAWDFPEFATFAENRIRSNMERQKGSGR